MPKSNKANNKNLLTVLSIVIIAGLAMLYYVSIRNQNITETFEDYMNSSDVKQLIKDNGAVLVFHKMDGCGHCVAFTPTWNKFVELHDGKLIKCAMVDPTNDLSADVEGFPTIRLYKSVNDYIEFNDERTLEALTNFVKQNK